MPSDDIARLHDFQANTTIQSAQVDAEFDQIISTINGKFGRSVANTLTGNNIFSGTSTFSGIATFSSAITPVRTDKVDEYTPAAGVTIDSVRMKDGMVKVSGTPTDAGEIGYAGNAMTFHNGTSVKTISTSPGYAGTISKSANYTAVAADNAFLIACTETFTLSLTAAATLGGAWFCHIRNEGSGIITIDPDGSETIDLQSSLLVYPGEAFCIQCDASNFRTVGRDYIARSFDSGNQTISNAGGLTLAHGLGAKPKLVQFFLICQSAELGYGSGDEVMVCPGAGASSGATGFTAFTDATNIGIRFTSLTNPILIFNKTTGVSGFATNASWRFTVRAYA